VLPTRLRADFLSTCKEHQMKVYRGDAGKLRKALDQTGFPGRKDIFGNPMSRKIYSDTNTSTRRLKLAFARDVWTAKPAQYKKLVNALKKSFGKRFIRAEKKEVRSYHPCALMYTVRAFTVHLTK
jgi:hypothetical protein